MRLTKDYIWDYDIKKLDLKNPEVLLWYLQRKVEYGDWKAIDRKTLKKYLPKLKVNPYLKQILRNFLKKMSKILNPVRDYNGKEKAQRKQISNGVNNFQKEILKEIEKNELSQYFIWSGGTALSYQYLRHRLSYDLDFFSKDLLPGEYLLSQIRQIAKNLKIKKIEEQKRFNRHEFWLKRNKEITRIEFVFLSFSRY